MKLTFVSVVLCVLALRTYASALNWPSPAVSWWYSPDNNWPLLIEQVTPHTNVVTSVIVYCGPEVTDAGTITTDIDTTCIDAQGNGTLPSLTNLGIRTELALNSGNCSIDAYRILWADTNVSIAAMVALAEQTKISGWNIDLEPQGDNCKQGATGDAADAVLFASWLTALKDALHAINVRLTVDVANWSPVLSQFEVLAPSVDRLMDMETYNAPSFASWLGNYDTIVNSEVPREAVGVGLGCWIDSSTNGTWSATPAAAVQRIAQCQQDNIVELAMFRLDPVTNENPSSWPEQFWWEALANYTARS